MISYLMWLETLDDDERKFFTKLFEDFSPKVKYVAWGLTHNNAEADDITGAVFERVMRHKEKFVAADNKEINRLLIIYTRSIFIDENRRRKKIGFESYDEPCPNNNYKPIDYIDEGVNITEELIQKETAALLRRKVEELGEPASTIIYLTYFADHSSSEVAKILNINASTVRTILQKSREKLKTEMEGYIYGTDK